MNLNSVNRNNFINTEYSAIQKKYGGMANSCVTSPYTLHVNQLNSENIRANYSPISFKGNAPKITKAYIITSDTDDIPLLATKQNNSYFIDFDSQTEVIYGIDAIKYLKRNPVFDYDTQVIIPKRAEGVLNIDGKNIPLTENSAVLINEGTKANVELKKGYPMIILSKRDYDWYERYSRDAQDMGIKNKFSELMYFNSHSYNGEFSPNALLPEKFRDESFLAGLYINKWDSKNYLLNDIYARKDMLSDEDKKTIEFIKGAVDKLDSNGMLIHKEDGYIRLANNYAKDYLIKDLKSKGFTQEEIDLLIPVLVQARGIKSSGKFAIKNPAGYYSPELIQKMKDRGILYNNQRDSTENIYWKECYPSEQALKDKLSSFGFSFEEQNTIIQNWHKANSTGFDLSGLKFINENVAVYNLNDKSNNWTGEKTNWVSNSTALTSSNGTTPFVGVSMVQNNEKRPVKISEIRKGEVLHTHPNLNEKRQTEMYLITSGAAALNVVKNGKTEVVILKEGELAVVGPGVPHCVNSVLGEYEQIVAQLPSAFQYGYGFKTVVDLPKGYSKEALEQQAFEKLNALKDKNE